MLDVSTAADFLEAGGVRPLPAGSGEVGETLPVSSEPFAAALQAQSGGDTGMGTPGGSSGAGADEEPATSNGSPVSPVPSTEDGSELPPAWPELATLLANPTDVVLIDERATSPEEAKIPDGGVNPDTIDQVDGDGDVAFVRLSTGQVSAQLPDMASAGESVDSTGNPAIHQTETNTSVNPVVPTREIGVVDPGDVGQIEHARNAQRPENVPPGHANDQRSPATVAEDGGGTRFVPPTSPDILASSVVSGQVAPSVGPAPTSEEGAPLTRLASAPGTPADFDPMMQGEKMAALREQVDQLVGRQQPSVSPPDVVAESSSRRTSADPSQVAVQLAQAVQGAMLAEGDGVLAKLLRAPSSSGDAQFRPIVQAGTPPVTVDVSTADGGEPQTSLPQFGFAAMADDEMMIPVLRGTELPVPFDMARAETRRSEEVTRLLEQVRRAPTEVVPTGMSARVSDIAHNFAVAAARVTGSSQSANLEQYELPDQLVRAIRMQWRDGVGEARIRLNPPQLGEVQVALQVRQGVVSAVLSSDSDVVRGWMRSQQHELKAMLATQGLELDQLVVEEDRQSRQQADESFEHARRRSPRRPASGARFEVRV